MKPKNIQELLKKFDAKRTKTNDPNSLELWVKSNGRFARLVDMKVENGKLYAGIRIKAWEETYVEVPDDVTMTLEQFCSIKHRDSYEIKEKTCQT